ncbi:MULTISPECIES: 3-hydroxyisobutyrate dehydrogenase [unclassified Moraxella]|uniref:3-hydroxyisobutyrate dehydrogenase n=1 Tax=unclassified Moraxella TaxID=2685852 RepID=UPI003AF5E3EA
MKTIQKIAFIGLGNMGKPMAENLIKKGFALNVFDLNQAVLDDVAKQGATVASSPVEASKNVDMVITMLPAGQHVKSVYIGENGNGLIDAVASDTILVDCSTIASSDAKAVAEVAKAKSITFMDAPVSGGTGGATAGTLTFIVGGEQADFETIKPVLQAMGKNIFHAGDVGAGQVAKICNNMLLGILMSGTAEAINLGVKNGLDAKVLSDIMLQSSGRNWTLEVYNPYPNVLETVPSSKGYTGGFMSKLMLKDMNLAKQTAEDTGVATPMADQANALYTKHSEVHGDKDFSSILGQYDENVLG